MLQLTAPPPTTITQESSNWIAQMAVPYQATQQTIVSTPKNNDAPIKALIAYADNNEEKNYQRRINRVLNTISRQIKRSIHRTSYEVALEDAWQYKDDLETSHLILLLVGPDFVDTDFCYCDELKNAIDNHHYSKAYVVPIYLRPCLLEDVPFGGLPFLPGKLQGAVSTMDEDVAFQIIAEELTQIARIIIGRLL